MSTLIFLSALAVRVVMSAGGGAENHEGSQQACSKMSLKLGKID